MRSYSAVDVGLKRKINQDCVFASEEPIGNLANLFIVADGMGGHNAGDFASRFAVNSIVEYVRHSDETNIIKLIQDAIEAANSGIVAEAADHEELRGMGTTLVVTTIADEYVYIANVGDSRCYIMNGGLRQITKDHSLVEEMVRMGEISREDARNHPDKNIITRALGAASNVEVDFFDYKIEADTGILMCSDGLTNMVEDSDIEKVLMKDEPIEEKVRTLIDKANENGGKDNIAVIIIDNLCQCNGNSDR